MEHISFYTDMLRGNFREGSYIMDSEKHVMASSGYGSFLS
jgi:hypothetical protein